MNFIFILLSFSEWTAFLGRFHPLFVHLPIGFLILIVLIEIFKFLGKLTVTQELIKILLFATLLSAIMACVAGYFLSLEGGYNEELLSEHKWQGFWVAILSFVAYMAHNQWLTNKIGINKVLYFPTLVLATLLMFVAGHHGGSLTHGETYLTENTPQPIRKWLGITDKKEAQSNGPREKIKNINEALVYQDIIHPIFEEKCEKCHNANKKKGDLRMDEIALFKKGGKNGVIFKANLVDESEFIKRILLPESDEHHMPPKGKNQITENELSLLKWWVEQGATFENKVSKLKITEPIKPILASLGGGGGTTQNSSSTIKQDIYDKEISILAKEVSAIDEDFKNEIKKSGGLVLQLAQNSNYIELSFLNNHSFSDNESFLLSKALTQTLWLKLNNTKITDKSLVDIAKLSNLTRLHIENTKISDNGLIQLANLQNLEYLNLIGTSITDSGLQRLSILKNLKKLYLWKTKVTQAGADKLKRTLPNLTIDLGITEQQVAELLESKAKKSSDDVYLKK